MGVFIRSIGSPDLEDMKKFIWEGFYSGTLFWEFLGTDLKRLKWQKPLEMG